MESKLDYVSTGVDNIRLDMKDQGRQINAINDRLIRCEESTKSAHKRLDNSDKKIEALEESKN
jgi:septal ring factor EnvC (AmiA/AmiB activator)